MPFDEIFNEETDVTVTAAACPVTIKPHSDEDRSLAMVYSPYQDFEDLYDKEDALKNGTLYKALYKPYIGGSRPR